jgi:hypothetical protein
MPKYFRKVCQNKNKKASTEIVMAKKKVFYLIMMTNLLFSMRDLNPQPAVNKTVALPIELIETFKFLS